MNTSESYLVGIDNQAVGNCSYDAFGNLSSDNAENISKIGWTLYGIIASINNTGYFDFNKNGDTYFRILSNGYVGVGTPAHTSQIHTTGTVRFAGLTNYNSFFRVLVSDINGNLFYRELSSIAINDNLRSSMAINGSLNAKRIKITEPGIWQTTSFKLDILCCP